MFAGASGHNAMIFFTVRLRAQQLLPSSNRHLELCSPGSSKFHVPHDDTHGGGADDRAGNADPHFVNTTVMC